MRSSVAMNPLLHAARIGSERAPTGPLMSRAKREGCRGVPMEVENINGEVRRKREGGGLVGNGG
jgi:hypothetical protein